MNKILIGNIFLNLFKFLFICKKKNMKSIISYLTISVITVFLFSCGNTDESNNRTTNTVKVIEEKQVEIKNKEEIPKIFIDNRDGKKYKIVKIGNQIWFAENLAFKPDSSTFWVYEEKQENVKKYGYLYDYKTALEVVPQGWHLPTKKEFETLLNHYKEEPFKSLTEDKNGLSIVFGGWFFDESWFVKEGSEVGFWSSDKENDNKAWLLIADKDFKQVSIQSRYAIGTGAAVRLIKN